LKTVTKLSNMEDFVLIEKAYEAESESTLISQTVKDFLNI